MRSADPVNNVFVIEVEFWGNYEDLEVTLDLAIAEYFEVEQEQVDLDLLEGSTKRQVTTTSVIEVTVRETVSSGHSLAPFFGLFVVIAAVVYHL